MLLLTCQAPGALFVVGTRFSEFVVNQAATFDTGQQLAAFGGVVACLPETRPALVERGGRFCSRSPECAEEQKGYEQRRQKGAADEHAAILGGARFGQLSMIDILRWRP
jgi:hypothetical protein